MVCGWRSQEVNPIRRRCSGLWKTPSSKGQHSAAVTTKSEQDGRPSLAVVILLPIAGCDEIDSERVSSNWLGLRANARDGKSP